MERSRLAPTISLTISSLRFRRQGFGNQRYARLRPSAAGEQTMRVRIFLALVLGLAVAAGYPYAALILNRMIGTSTVVFAERDGLDRRLILGPDAPRPDWLPLFPGSLVVQAGHWLPSPGREIAGDLELVSHADLEDIKQFYLDALSAAGF